MDHLTTRRVDLPVLQLRLKERREALRLDQEALAERAGLSAGYISRLERGAVPNPKVFDLEKVATALETSVGALLAARAEPPADVYVDECRAIIEMIEQRTPGQTETLLRWFRESVKTLPLASSAPEHS